MLDICVAGATGWAGRALVAGVIEADDPLLRSAITRSAAAWDLARARRTTRPSADTGRRAPSGSGMLLAVRLVLERSRVIHRLDTLLFESSA